MTATPFRVSVPVRVFDCDTQGHLASANYLNFASQALWSCLRSAGVDVDAMVRDGLGPVYLETKVRFLREFRTGDDIDLSCKLVFGGGKTYCVQIQFRHPDNGLGAEVETICGLLDLASRRLSANPAAEWQKRAEKPEILGL